LFVEEAGPWYDDLAPYAAYRRSLLVYLCFCFSIIVREESSILPLARSIDPAFNRSALVFTKFNPFLRSVRPDTLSTEI
jgi:hypothetical protein